MPSQQSPCARALADALADGAASEMCSGDEAARCITGVVIAEIVVDPSGAVTDAKVVQSIPLLDEAALQAVRNWHYTPTVVNGQPVPVRLIVTVNFSQPPTPPSPSPAAPAPQRR
jgi:TonB family protein